MNMKVVSMCLICAGALLTGCGNGGKKEAETSERKEKEAVGKSSVSCPLKPSDSAPLKHSTMPP